jgi:hypothetical protein
MSSFAPSRFSSREDTEETIGYKDGQASEQVRLQCGMNESMP